MKSSRLDSGKLYSAFSMVAAVYHEAEEVSRLRENAAREGWDYAAYSIAIADAAGGTGLGHGGPDFGRYRQETQQLCQRC